MAIPSTVSFTSATSTNVKALGSDTAAEGGLWVHRSGSGGSRVFEVYENVPASLVAEAAGYSGAALDTWLQLRLVGYQKRIVTG